jgi:transposase
MRKTRRVVSDELWSRISQFLPPHPPQPKGGRPWADDRECLEGILWVLRSGARWCDVPVDLPSGPTCWRRLRDWTGEGVLEDIQQALLEELEDAGGLDFSQLVADATFVRGKKGATTSEIPSAARV